jgi:peptide chain release factor 2
MGEPGFWDNQEHAAQVSAEHARTSRKLTRFQTLERDIEDLGALTEMADEDPSLQGELLEQVASVEERLQELEEERLFSGRYDAGDAFVTVNAGAGGTDAQDWAEMVLRMEMRWAEKRGFDVELLEASPGEEAGIKSATFLVKGENAYGLYGSEKGVHRLVRLSPFDSANRRQTSFAGVEVSPVVEDVGAVEIDEDDLKVDTYRASGAGGQHINKTDSAVRLTHAPTGIVVQCQNDRSQHRNRAEAMQMLKAKLYEFEMRKRQVEKDNLENSKTDVGWGHQIRSYVLDNSRIKDLRTNVEISNTKAVLDGDLDDFIGASLKQGV